MSSPRPSSPAPLILRTVRNVSHDEPVDLVINQGRVERVVPAGTAQPAGEEVNGDGRWVIPGLWDRHVHFTQWALARSRVDVSRATSAAHAGRLIATAVASELSPPGIVVAAGYRDGLWEDDPTAALLDNAAADRPVVVISGDLHACWLNSAARARLGFPGDAAIAREEEAFAIVAALDDLADEEKDARVASAAAHAASRGVVGVVDLEMTWSFDSWVRRVGAGIDQLRVDVGVYPEDLDRAIDAGLRTGDVIPGARGLVRVGPFKVITDGSLNTRTAYCYDPYPGQDTNYGLLTVPPERLESLVRRAVQHGLRPAVHAIGDHANTHALDVFERVGCVGSIEHAQLVSERDFARFARLGVVASVQPEHALDDRDVADHYWHGRTDRAFALRTLVETGASLAMGSDAPVAPLDPWITMSAAVDRARADEQPWHPEQKIDRRAALAASSPHGVEVGEGMVADLCLVDADPLTVSSDVLRSMPVSMTLLGGRVTFERA